MTEPRLSFSRLERGLAAVGLPRLALHFAAGRFRFEQARAYLDAAQTSRLTKDWRKQSATARDVWQSDAATIRYRARYLHQNDPFARQAVELLVDNVVFTGISTQCQIKYTDDAAANERQNTKVEDLIQRWQEEADATPDRDQRMHWYELQQAWFRGTVIDGGMLLRRRYSRDRSRVLPLCYELLELDRLSSFGATPAAGNTLVNGIEYDADGYAVAYHVSRGLYRTSVERVLASEIVHRFRADRPDAAGGISWLAPMIPDLMGLKAIKEYAEIARKVQAAIALVITGGAKQPGRLPALTPESTASTTTEGGDPLAYLEPGLILREPNAATVHSHNPSPSNDLDVHTRLILRGIGVGAGLSYESLSGDYSGVNFAGGRLSNINARRRFTVLHGWLVRGGLTVTHRHVIDAALAFSADMPRVPAGATPYAARYSQPRWELGVNPVQEVTAAILRIQAGLSSLREEIEALGGDAEETWRQIAAEADYGAALDPALNLHPDLAVELFTGAVDEQGNPVAADPARPLVRPRRRNGHPLKVFSHATQS